MKKILVLLLLLQTIACWSQSNIALVSKLNYQFMHQTELNDIWGHVDTAGNEYALVGARKGTSIVSLANPNVPTEVFWEEGTFSVWRDLKTWKNYAYVTTEAQEGLLILDLTSLPDASAIQSNYYFGPTNDTWKSAHNLFIDSSGYAYIFGANRGNGGVLILDLNADPMNPTEVGVFDTWYAHDGYVQNDTMYLAHVFDGFMSMVDITDRTNPKLLGTKETPSRFSHNIWTTANGKYAFTTDEVSGGYLASYDVSNPSQITELDRVQSSPGANVMPHNVHVLGDFLVTSYYSDGVTIHDISRPHNLIQTGNYDTYPDQTIGSDGCWGVYPFLPSGLILASDISQGLFILDPTYAYACYLEGTVTSSANNQELTGVEVQIIGDKQLEKTNALGFYATGILKPDSYQVSFSKVGYYPKTIAVTLSQQNVNLQDVQLDPIPTFPFKVKVVDATTNDPILDAQIRFTGSQTTDEAQSDGLGEAVFNFYYEESYTYQVGKWGYTTSCANLLIDTQTGELIVKLDAGIYDDFSFDFGWSTTAVDAVAGFWERGVPVGTFTGSAPNADTPDDCGTQAYLTGNSVNKDPAVDDVQEGSVTLKSPVFDLSSYADPAVRFKAWFYNYHGDLPFDDSLKIYLSNGTESILIYSLKSDPVDFGFWHDVNIKVKDFITPTAQMRLTVETSDWPNSSNITEAAFDHFFVNEYQEIGINEQHLSAFLLYPNPAHNSIQLRGLNINSPILIYDAQGRLAQQALAMAENQEIVLKGLKPGIYVVKHSAERVRLIVE